MSCSTLNTNLDIEDIHKKDVDFSKITDANRKYYNSVVFDIHKWVVNNVVNGSDDDHYVRNLKKRFHKYFANLTRKVTKEHGIYVKKSLIVYCYRRLIKEGKIVNLPVMWSFIQKRPSRNISGITEVTLLTSPTPDGQKFSCKHNCYMCPNEPGQPRSYLTKEPAVARATRHNHEAIPQMNDRLDALLQCGHEIDKLEIIIEGGTYTEYPVAYLERFHRDIIYVANTYFDKGDKRAAMSLQDEIEINRSSKVKIIGICIETRPDALIMASNDKHWIRNLREWGVTRVQIGIQSLDDDVLFRINRGHTVNESIEAINLLKLYGFKVDVHMMPDLPGATPQTDKEGFQKLFYSSHFMPDQVKVYPTEVVPWTVLKKMYEKGTYTPYAEKNERDILDVVKHAMKICPPWIRLPRVVRDIPTEYISAGNPYPNLRQMLEKELEDENTPPVEIRYREIGRHPEYKFEDAMYVYRKNNTNCGLEYFISLESPDHKAIFGFIRLLLPHYVSNYVKTSNDFVARRYRENYMIFPDITSKALVRELHVYGNVVPVGHKKKGESQHRGVGKGLLSRAEWIAYAHQDKYNGIVVISGIGVKDYYASRGYKEIDTYMVKKFKTTCDSATAWFLLFSGFVNSYISANPDIENSNNYIVFALLSEVIVYFLASYILMNQETLFTKKIDSIKSILM